MHCVSLVTEKNQIFHRVTMSSLSKQQQKNRIHTHSTQCNVHERSSDSKPKNTLIHSHTVTIHAYTPMQSSIRCYIIYTHTHGGPTLIVVVRSWKTQYGERDTEKTTRKKMKRTEINVVRMKHRRHLQWNQPNQKSFYESVLASFCPAMANRRFAWEHW